MLRESLTSGMKRKNYELPCLCIYLVLFVIENTAAHPLVSLTSLVGRLSLTSLVGRLPLTSHVGGGRVVGPTPRKLQRKDLLLHICRNIA